MRKNEMLTGEKWTKGLNGFYPFSIKKMRKKLVFLIINIKKIIYITEIDIIL